MGLFSSAPITSSSASAETTFRANPASQAERTLNLAVSAAAGQLNEASYLGEGREVQHSIAPGTHTPVVQVVDTKTKEVITQWPPEYLLQLAAELKATTKDSG
jgi:uncharacterized FlaG/YvyC family protein